MIKNSIEELEIGDWCFFDSKAKGNESYVVRDAYIALRFLEGDRGLCILPIANEKNNEPNTIQVQNSYGQSCWFWNGDVNFPTLNPSILHWGDGKDKPASWHGFLRNGNLVTA